MTNELQLSVVEVMESEDWCFICKDGGQLILCDYGGCTKVYHPECVQRIECSEIEQDWHCAKHFCFLCKKEPWYHCYTCPTSLCTECSKSAYFFTIRGQNGFCEVCVGLVSILESSETPKVDGVALDLHDRETYECLFSEYWNVIKVQETLTMEEIIAATCSNKIVKKPSYAKLALTARKEDSEVKKTYDIQSISSSDDDFPVKRIKRKFSNKVQFDTDSDDELPKTKMMRKFSKKLQFDGWCSKPLKNFLVSIGKDTSKILSHYDVESIVYKYAEEHKLWNKKNKKTINCDEVLYSLLGRKSVRRFSIHQQLEIHLSGNTCHSDDGSEKESYLSNEKQKQESVSVLDIEEDETEGENSKFASVNAENLKLIFLKRSVVEELLKAPEEFNLKVSGCFVRVKSHPLDFRKKTSHQLVLVKGIATSTPEDACGEVHLLFDSLPADTSVSSLSDSDFSQEEVEDLRDRIEKNVHPKLLYKEVKEKAVCLHKDITKHWIKEELERLQNLINLSNEKGWRAEMAEYLSARELLNTPTEQERLLRINPKVAPEYYINSIAD